MRRLWFVLGMVIGALLIWAFTHEDRKIAQKEREYNKRMEDYNKETVVELATLGALHGVDYLSDEYWEQELSQYKDEEDNS